MSVIESVKVEGTTTRAENSFKEATRRAMWAWFRDNRDLRIARKRFWFFTLRLYVKDLRFLFEMLFGPEKDEWNL